METTHRTVNLAPRYGITIAIISIIFSIIFNVTKTSDNLWTGYFGALLVFLGVLFSVIHYNSQHHEKTSMMALFGVGFRTTLWAVIIFSLFSLVLHLLEPDKTADSNYWISLLGNVLFVPFVLGMLAAVIGAMAFKKNQKTTRPTR
jgi:vacuolar-type H+-ATPase subunit I/STV1